MSAVKHGISLSRGWYLQWLWYGHPTGIVLTTGKASSIGVRWGKVPMAARGFFWLRLP